MVSCSAMCSASMYTGGVTLYWLLGDNIERKVVVVVDNIGFLGGTDVMLCG